MNFLADNWYVVVITLVAIAGACYSIYAFIQLSPAQQKEKVREWLIWAVIQAEAELGGGTGQLKLRKVYEMFITAFPWLVKAISFAEFSQLVDEALAKMKEMLQNNEKIKEFVAAGGSISTVSIETILELLKKLPDKE